MAEKKQTATAEETTAETVYVPRQSFAGKYGKPILIGAGAVIILGAGWLGWKYLIKEPKETEAAEAIFPAEKLFAAMANAAFSKDSTAILLKGGMLGAQKITGLLSIMDKYSGTAAGNRAHYMAGAAYLQTGDFKNAVEHLDDFDACGAYQTDIKRNVMLGHAYAEQNKKEEALKAYKKAAGINEKDESLTPDALVMAAAYASSIGNQEEAITLYKKVRDNYPAYQGKAAAERELAKAGVFE